MEEKIPKAIENVLQVLSDKFGATGKELWTAIVKQQLIDASMSLLLSIISAVVTIVAVVKISTANDDFESIPWGWWILGAITICIFFASLWSAITGFFNKEYAALDDVLGKVKSK